MSLIKISNLTFGYDNSYDNIFENVSFSIDTNWKLGFTGRNGRGKTTFLNLLLGKYKYQGSITSSVTFDYFPFHVSDKTLNTLDILNNICPDCQSWQINRELSLLKVSEDVLYRPFNTLSNGEQTKVMLAALFLKDNNFLLIDEPTNHLDMAAREIVSDYLKGKKGFILVSHDRAFLDNCVEYILSINKTNIEIQRGNFSSWYYNKKLQDNFEMKQNKKLKGEIEKLESAARQTAMWSEKVEKGKFGNGSCDRGYVGHMAAKMMTRSKAIESRQQRAIDEKSKLLKNIETCENLSISPLKYYKDKMIEVKDLSISYGTRQVCSNINFSIQNGERAALLGKNGCGKSSIIKLILGNNINFNGNVNCGKNLIISYVPQDTSFLHGSLDDFAKVSKIDETLFKTILRKLDFARIQFEKNMESYSEGQKKKVLIAKSLCEHAHLYIWDEPLNFIDVISRMQIEDLILKYNPTMLFVEHDISFVNDIATKKINLF